MKLFLGLPGAEVLAADLATLTGGTLGEMAARCFPDGEHSVRIISEAAGATVYLVADLHRPDELLLPLVFAADALRELRAERVELVAPYLPYMRQDRRFRPGEAVSSASIARLLSREFDGLTTVDPHLHRRTSLHEIFSIPTHVAHAAALVGGWIAANVKDPLIVGPDEEAGQWAREAALHAKAPCILLAKERRGDRDVLVSGPDLSAYAGRTPVIVDDIISSGRTVAEAAGLLTAAGLARPVVVAVHALISPQDQDRLMPSVARLVSTDTVRHPSNAISVTALLAATIGAELVAA
jgi:ribose-phosphate pyrophosphokinase